MEYSLICPICGKKFSTTHKLYLYCSPECRAEARRKQDRERKREKTAQRAAERKAASLEAHNRRKADGDEALRKSQEDFEKRCRAGDPAALLIKEQTAHGITGERYWKLYAQAARNEAEAGGNRASATVNGFSVFSDTFAEDVARSIRNGAQVVKGTIFRKRTGRG
jgi:hypothetical protein